jgi:hypothetical protein
VGEERGEGGEVRALVLELKELRCVLCDPQSYSQGSFVDYSLIQTALSEATSVLST